MNLSFVANCIIPLEQVSYNVFRLFNHFASHLTFFHIHLFFYHLLIFQGVLAYHAPTRFPVGHFALHASCHISLKLSLFPFSRVSKMHFFILVASFTFMPYVTFVSTCPYFSEPLHFHATYHISIPLSYDFLNIFYSISCNLLLDILFQLPLDILLYNVQYFRAINHIHLNLCVEFLLWILLYYNYFLFCGGLTLYFLVLFF